MKLIKTSSKIDKHRTNHVPHMIGGRLTQGLLLATCVSLHTGCETEGSSYEYPQSSQLGVTSQGSGQSGTTNGYSKSIFAAYIAMDACDLYQECDLLQGYGGNVEDCRVAVESGYNALLNATSCNYDEDVALECLTLVQDMTCDDLQDGSENACDLVCGREWE